MLLLEKSQLSANACRPEESERTGRLNGKAQEADSTTPTKKCVVCVCVCGTKMTAGAVNFLDISGC